MVGKLLFLFRMWRHDTAEVIRWRIAYCLPRSVALLAFVRVASATGEDPDEIRFASAYRAWEKGAGR